MRPKLFGSKVHSCGQFSPHGYRLLLREGRYTKVAIAEIGRSVVGDKDGSVQISAIEIGTLYVASFENRVREIGIRKAGAFNGAPSKSDTGKIGPRKVESSQVYIIENGPVV